MINIHTLDFIMNSLIMIGCMSCILYMQYRSHEIIMKELGEIKKENNGRK